MFLSVILLHPSSSVLIDWLEQLLKNNFFLILESGRQLEQSSKDLKEERQLRKQVESQLSSLQEELADLTTAHSTSVKVI